MNGCKSPKHEMPPVEIKSEMLSCGHELWPARQESRLKALKVLNAAIDVHQALGLEADEVELQEFLEWLPETAAKPEIQNAALAYLRAVR